MSCSEERGKGDLQGEDEAAASEGTVGYWRSFPHMEKRGRNENAPGVHVVFFCIMEFQCFAFGHDHGDHQSNSDTLTGSDRIPFPHPFCEFVVTVAQRLFEKVLCGFYSETTLFHSHANSSNK